ncbi:MAG: hypothetical protein LBD88_03525 [Candidatus Peribacteria bacterium]|jgi:mRNA-degrading endonuclease RelE of RelBE toxin-antitoxin system|nr:hypothetical protein [Candidatus Peribacteria bacterium]
MVELRDDPEELKKVLEYFEKNKPNIAAPIEFKKSLRSKLDNIIALKL